MNMKFKHFALILALFAFTASLFAQPATYSFSSFGGGLPSSAARVSMAAGAKKATTERIIVADDEDYEDYENYEEDDDETPDYNYSDEPKVNKHKKTGLIVTYVVLGVVVTAGIIVGAYYLTNESANCCAEVTDNLFKGCGEGCGEACGETTADACSSSSSNSSCGSSSSSSSCGSSSSSSSSCSSSSGSSSSDCSSSIGNVLANGFQLIPIYVP